MPGHLIHVGFPKAGSTALGAWFESRPELAYAPNALAGHYHAFELASSAAAAPDPPLWHVTSAESFSAPRATDDPLAGAAPPGVASMSEARRRVCATLAGLFPQATILVVTRGFRAILLSVYSQYVKSGGTLGPQVLAQAHGADVAELLDYDAVVAMYEEAFGAPNVIVLPYELLRDDPAAFVAQLEARLALPARDGLVPRRNVALSPGGLAWHRRLSVLVGAAARVLPARLGARLFRVYVALTRGDRLRRPLELVERVVPGSRDPQLSVPAELLEGFRGRAASLAGRPFYDRYASDYLNA